MPLENFKMMIDEEKKGIMGDRGDMHIIIDDICCEIKGLLVNVEGNPSVKEGLFDTKDGIDSFIDEVEIVLKDNLLPSPDVGETKGDV